MVLGRERPRAQTVFIWARSSPSVVTWPFCVGCRVSKETLPDSGSRGAATLSSSQSFIIVAFMLTSVLPFELSQVNFCVWCEEGLVS